MKYSKCLKLLDIFSTLSIGFWKTSLRSFSYIKLLLVNRRLIVYSNHITSMQVHGTRSAIRLQLAVTRR